MKNVEITAISDRILIIQDPKLPLQEKEPQIGVVYSIGPGCCREGLEVKEGDRVVFGRGAHAERGDYKIIREEQLYAVI